MMDIPLEILERSDRALAALQTDEFASPKHKEDVAIHEMTRLMISLACSVRDRERELAVKLFAEGIFNCLVRLDFPTDVCMEARRFLYELENPVSASRSGGRPSDGGQRLRLKEMCVAAAEALFDAGSEDPYGTVFEAAKEAHHRLFDGRKFTADTVANWRNDGISKNSTDIEATLKRLTQEAKDEGRSKQFAAECLAYLKRM